MQFDDTLTPLVERTYMTPDVVDIGCGRLGDDYFFSLNRYLFLGVKTVPR